MITSHLANGSVIFMTLLFCVLYYFLAARNDVPHRAKSTSSAAQGTPKSEEEESTKRGDFTPSANWSEVIDERDFPPVLNCSDEEVEAKMAIENASHALNVIRYSVVMSSTSTRTVVVDQLKKRVVPEVALCLTGYFHENRRERASWKEFSEKSLTSHLDVDLFVSTYDAVRLGDVDKWVRLTAGPFGTSIHTPRIDEEYIKPVYGELLKRIFITPVADIIKTKFGHVAQLILVQRVKCVWGIQQYEIEMDSTYDYFFLARADGDYRLPIAIVNDPLAVPIVAAPRKSGTFLRSGSCLSSVDQAVYAYAQVLGDQSVIVHTTVTRRRKTGWMASDFTLFGKRSVVSQVVAHGASFLTRYKEKFWSSIGATPERLIARLINQGCFNVQPLNFGLKLLFKYTYNSSTGYRDFDIIGSKMCCCDMHATFYLHDSCVMNRKLPRAPHGGVMHPSRCCETLRQCLSRHHH